VAWPYEYKNEKDETVKDVRMIERRAVNDVYMTTDKLDTVGISLDKVFAMSFLLQSTAVRTDSDSRQSNISYLNFEQWFLGINDPAESPIMQTILQVLSNRLKAGFFTPSRGLNDVNMEEIAPIGVNRLLGERTAVATVVSLAQNKWSAFDPFAEMFKVSRSSIGAAPAGRANVVRAGQKRDQSDTKVMFASQNALFAESMVESAASNEYFAGAKSSLHAAMAQLLNPEADGAVEKELVAQLRAANNAGQVISPELDKADSPINLEKQVAFLKDLLGRQMILVKHYQTQLENAEKENLGKVFAEFKAKAGKIKFQNDQLLVLPLLSSGFTYVVENAAKTKLKLKTGEVVPGDFVARFLMTGGAIEKDLNHQQDMLDRLSKFSGIVDPDTVGR
jgi:hypothetical protein